MTKEELVARRHALGMTRQELARALRVGYRTIQDWELGNRDGVLVNTDLVELALAELGRRAAEKQFPCPRGFPDPA